MKHKTRVFIRWILFIVCVSVIVYFQRTPGKESLGVMFVALAGLLGVLYDYNRDYTKTRERLSDYDVE